MAVETSGKKRSFLDSVKGAFIQESPDFTQPKEQAPSPAPEAPTLSTRRQTESFAAPTSARPELSQKFRQQLQAALESEKLDSYDYLKFKSAVADLSADIPDEKIRFKSAFAAAKALGITKDRLIETAKHYVLVLDQEKKKFEEAVDTQGYGKIEADQAHVAELDAQIDNRRQQIQKLNEEIEAAQKARNTLASQISDNKSAVESQKNSFVMTHTSMVQDINNDINKLSLFLT